MGFVFLIVPELATFHQENSCWNWWGRNYNFSSGMAWPAFTQTGPCSGAHFEIAWGSKADTWYFLKRKAKQYPSKVSWHPWVPISEHKHISWSRTVWLCLSLPHQVWKICYVIGAGFVFLTWKPNRQKVLLLLSLMLLYMQILEKKKRKRMCCFLNTKATRKTVVVSQVENCLV